MKLLLTAALALVLPAGYVNPTPGRAVAPQIPGMHEAEVRRSVHPGGHHGFEAHESTPRSRAILRRTLAFLRAHLLR